jgi:hypothetical protein
MFTIENNFNADNIVTNKDGFTVPYSVNDLLPYRKLPRLIDDTLYKGIQITGPKQDKPIAVPIPACSHIGAALAIKPIISQHRIHFKSKSNVRIVVFWSFARSTILRLLETFQQKSIL